MTENLAKTEQQCGEAWGILTHWVESARAIGNEPLTEVMENALRDLERQGWQVQRELERAESR